MPKNFIKTTSHQDNQSKQNKGATPLAPSSSYEEMTQIFRKTSATKIDEEKREKIILVARKILNDGDIDKARKIFAHVGHYDGMVQVAQKYYQSGKILEAYATFLQAGAKNETNKIANQIVQGIQTLIKK